MPRLVDIERLYWAW